MNFFINSKGLKLAYQYSEGSTPLIVFCPGFKSDMEGSKALFLEEECKNKGWAYLRFDYSGHGKSGGKFEEGVISRWTEDAYEAINQVSSGDIILVGSSMGGWVSLLLSKKLKSRLKGFVGIGAAPDFTEKGMWQKWDENMQMKLLKEGRVALPSNYGEPYIITRELVEDGRTNQVLGAPIKMDIPVRLLQGLKDSSVPKEWPEKIAKYLTSNDVEITFVKDGDHSLSTPSDLSLIMQTLLRLHNKVTSNFL